MAKKKNAIKDNPLYKWATRWNLNYFGLVMGMSFFLFSLTPSLMPRAAFLQAFVGGVSFAVGYMLGVFGSWAFRGLLEYDFSAKTKRAAWNILLVMGPVLLVMMLFAYVNWQNEIRQLTDFDSLSNNHLIIMIVLAAVFAALFISIGKLVRHFFEFVQRKVSKWVSPRLALGIGLAAAVIVTYFFASGVVFDGFIAVADNIYSGKNQSDPEGYTPPPWPEHTGSPESTIPWSTLGYQGKKFVSDTSTVEEMEEFSGQPAQVPIRIYSGTDSADTPKARSEQVVEEMKRTNALEREVLVVVTPTGTGWIEPNAIRAIEHMYNGDVATVSMQYSYLPSWISTLVDRSRATETGVILFDAVYEEWKLLPENERPKLIVHGLSLGSFGMQSAFISPSDIVARTDGALFLGTPNFSEPWRTITDNRDEGSLEIRPVVDNYKYAVFGADKEDIQDNDSKSTLPRVLFQQHASDGVVWWNPDLLFNQPDWVGEAPGKDVLEDIFWLPIVSFFQISVDQAVAGGAPDGHGHNYRDTLVYAWASVVPPADWTDEKSDALQQKIFVVESKGGSNQ